MSGKMQPGRFTLRFNMNDPQQRMAVDILNRQGRQKAQFLAQALIHYTECKGAPHTAAPAMMDEHTLEQAVLAILAKHPGLMPQNGPAASQPFEDERPAQNGSEDPAASGWKDVMSLESLDAITKTLTSFRRQ